MINNIVACILLNIIFLTFVIAQQQYPNLRDIQIHANIIFNQNEKMYFYDYAITNSITSIGAISELEIDISRKAGTLDIDTSGLLFKNDGYTEQNYLLDYPYLKGRIVSVGFLKTPVGDWSGGLSYDLTASFGGIDMSHVQPGESVSGFELMSKGLPSIRRCIVSPFFDVDSLFPYPDDTTIIHYPPVDSVRNAVKFYGWTIGPTAPPMDFSATAWCDTLTSYISQSRALGWIKNQITANKYISRILIAKTQLQRNNVTDARVTLQAALIDVNADSTKNLTSEAYALIRYNTEYLMMQFFSTPTK